MEYGQVQFVDSLVKDDQREYRNALEEVSRGQVPERLFPQQTSKQKTAV